MTIFDQDKQPLNLPRINYALIQTMIGASLTVTERLAALVYLSMVEGVTLTCNASQGYVARVAGINPITVSKALSKLKKAGLITPVVFNRRPRFGEPVTLDCGVILSITSLSLAITVTEEETDNDF